MRTARNRAVSGKRHCVKGHRAASREVAVDLQAVAAIGDRLCMRGLCEVLCRIIADDHNVPAAVCQLSDCIGKIAERFFAAACGNIQRTEALKFRDAFHSACKVCRVEQRIIAQADRFAVRQILNLFAPIGHLDAA